MKTTQEYFDEYAGSHQNETNQIIHYICVPLIFFSVIGLLMSIPNTFLENTLGFNNPFLENWATVITVFISIFYLSLGFWFFVEMLFIILLFIIGNFWIENNYNPFFYFSIVIFVLAWLVKFYGHKVEGAKPSFLKDLEFLLISPLWVIQKIGKRKK